MVKKQGGIFNGNSSVSLFLTYALQKKLELCGGLNYLQKQLLTIIDNKF
jgi:hypothetical protein